MVQGKDDFAYDLAFEILYGGDRFDQNDLAYAIGSLMKREDVEGFRDSVRKSIARITAEKRDKLPSVDFVESQLKCWVPDDIAEQGALLCKYRDEGKGGPEVLCAEGNCVFPLIA